MNVLDTSYIICITNIILENLTWTFQQSCNWYGPIVILGTDNRDGDLDIIHDPNHEPRSGRGGGGAYQMKMIERSSESVGFNFVTRERERSLSSSL